MKKDKRKLILLIGIIVVLVLASGLMIWNNQTSKQNKENTENQMNASSEQDNGLIDWNNTENVKIENGEKTNNSNELQKDKTFEGMKVTNITLSTQNGITDFKATVENITSKDFTGKPVVMIFINQDGSEMARLEGYLGDVPKEGSNIIDASTTADIANAYDFKIEIVK